MSEFDYILNPVTGCWSWGLAWTKDGSPAIEITGEDGETRWRPAKRVYYEKFRGSVPEGFIADNTCGNSNCVNPEHLEVKA